MINLIKKFWKTASDHALLGKWILSLLAALIAEVLLVALILFNIPKMEKNWAVYSFSGDPSQIPVTVKASNGPELHQLVAFSYLVAGALGLPLVYLIVCYYSYDAIKKRDEQVTRIRELEEVIQKNDTHIEGINAQINAYKTIIGSNTSIIRLLIDLSMRITSHIHEVDVLSTNDLNIGNYKEINDHLFAIMEKYCEEYCRILQEAMTVLCSSKDATISVSMKNTIAEAESDPGENKVVTQGRSPNTAVARRGGFGEREIIHTIKADHSLYHIILGNPYFAKSNLPRYEQELNEALAKRGGARLPNDTYTTPRGALYYREFISTIVTPICTTYVAPQARRYKTRREHYETVYDTCGFLCIDGNVEISEWEDERCVCIGFAILAARMLYQPIINSARLRQSLKVFEASLPDLTESTLDFS